MGSRHLTLKNGLDSHVAPESCQWLHDTGEFKAWDNPAAHEGDKKRVLVLKGKPGSGKSVLMSWALGRYESLRADTSEGPLILSFFFDARHSEPLNYTLEGFYRSLLSQILGLIPYRAAHKVLANSSRPGKDEKWDIIILKDIILQLLAFVEGQRIVLFLDALDECQKNEQYDLRNTADTLEFLKKLLHLDAHIQICLSIRNETILEEFFDSPYVLDIQAHNQPSIKKYLALELQKSKHLRPQFQTKLRSLLFSRSSNMFLWASLVVSDIKTAARSKEREDEILERVNETPKELNELYETMLRHANLGKREEALKLMQLVQVAVRPLTLAEIRSALHFSDDQFDERFSHLTTEDFSHNIHELSGGLIEVYSPSFFRDARSPAGKDPTRAVQFIHVSVRDFIRQGQEGLRTVNPKLYADNSELEAQHHLCMAKVCMGILATPAAVRLADSQVQKPAQRFAFLQYASHYWALHARKANDAMDEHFKRPLNLAQCSMHTKAIFKLFREYQSIRLYSDKNDISDCGYLRCRRQKCNNSSDARDCEDSLLVLLASEGCSKLVTIHAQRCPHSDRCYENRHVLERAFFFAVHRGWTETARSVWSLIKLKGVDINVDMLRINGSSPLYTACFAGRDDLVDFVLGLGASPFSRVDMPDELPLHAAAAQGYLKVVHLLLERTGHKAVELLAQRNSNYETVLHKAAEEGSYSTLLEILEHMTEHGLLHLVHAKNGQGETALELAKSRIDELRPYFPSSSSLLNRLEQTILTLDGFES